MDAFNQKAHWIISCRRALLFSSTALALAAVVVQVAFAEDSSVRFLSLKEQVQPAHAPDYRVAAKPTVKPVAATAPAVVEPEPDLAEEAPAQTAAQPADFAKAFREAIALRDAIIAPAPPQAAIREDKQLVHPSVTTAQPKAAPGQSSIVILPQTTTTSPHSVSTAPSQIAIAPRVAAPAPQPAAIPQPKVAPQPIIANPFAAVPSPAVTPRPVAPQQMPVAPSKTTVAATPAPVAAPRTTFVSPRPIAVAQEPAPAPRAMSAQPAAVPYIAAAPAVTFTVPARVAPAAPRVVAAPVAAPVVAAPPAPPAPPMDPVVVESTEALPACEEFSLGPVGCPYCPTQSGAHYICGVDCSGCSSGCCATWDNAHCIPWSLFGPGEYVGPARTEHVSNYYLRVNDLLTLTFIASRQKLGQQYRLGVGDRLRIESSIDQTLDREVTVQPDGEITLPIVGEVMAAGKTVKELRSDLLEAFKQSERQPQITVTPLEINTGLHDIIKAVHSEISTDGQAISLKVTPEGTIQAPGIGSVYVQGLTLEELRNELEARYAAAYGPGLVLSPALTERATSYVFVGGEVVKPDRYTLEGPTTVMQAIALAGSWKNGGNIHQVVVFRRDENWCLKATKIDIHAPLYGKDPCPVNDTWLRDNDLVIVPKSRILCATDVINLYFTRGVYAVFPVTFFQDLSRGSTIIP